MFWDDVNQIIKKQEEKFDERNRRLDELIKKGRELRRVLEPEKAQGNADVSLVAVDSAYKPRKDSMGKIDYAVVGVASSLAKHELLPFYASDIPEVLYEEDTHEEDLILKALGAVVEIRLLARRIGQYRWAFVDGSLFSTLIRLKTGLEAALNRGNDGIYLKAREEILSCTGDLENILNHGNLIAVPKFSSGGEFKAHIGKVWHEAKNYTDKELGAALLNVCEYVDLTGYVDKNRIAEILLRMKSLGLEVKGKAAERLQNFHLFYVKGIDRTVHRIEFFGPKEFFPADVVCAQSVSGTAQLELIAHADKMAKEYLNVLFPDDLLIFGSYR